jgi:general secretion pathway protein G
MALHSLRGTPARRWLARGCDPRLRHAFTLLEILVVLAIIGLLAGLAIQNIIRTQLNAEKAATRIMVNSSMKAALNQYRISVLDFPSTSDGLQALVQRPSAPGHASRWGGPYIEGSLPLDPWGQAYHYEYPGKHNKEGFDLWSSGPDRQSGTEDDITNWEVKPAGTPP